VRRFPARFRVSVRVRGARRYTFSMCRSILVAALAFVCSTAAFAQPPDLQLEGDTRIPRGARLYIDKIEGGYDIYLSAAMVKKEVPLILVTDPSRADFELTGVTETDKAGWAKMLFLGSTSSAEQASIKVVNVRTGTVVFGYNVNKSNSVRGKQSSSEACAKHLKEKIESSR
jgi:hypothetical protein